MEQIAIGIVAGLITTLCVVVLRNIWVKIIVPWYEERVYKDVRIEGKWSGKYEGKEYGEEIVNIERAGHSIKGEVTILNGHDKGKVYTFEGSFNNLILTAKYSAKNNTNLDQGTYCLMLKENGSKLVGITSIYEDTSHSIDYAKCTWVRKNS